MKEIVGEAAIERLVKLRNEADVAFPIRRANELLRTAGKDFIDGLPIVGRHVLHITRVLQSPFDFETLHTGIQHLLNAVAAVHVSKRKVVLGRNDPSVGINEVEREAAKLRALSSIG